MLDRYQSLRFVCWHVGPRGRQYGIPAVMAQAGILQRFFTDFCITPRVARALRRCPDRLRPKLVQNLLGRTLPPTIPPEKVGNVPLQRLWRGRGQNLEDLVTQQVQAHAFRGANAIFTTNNHDLELARQAKAQGLFVVADQVITPDVGLILRDERAAFPGIERQDEEDQIQRGIERDRELWRLADLVLTPAEYTRAATERLGGDRDKVQLVPYGLSPNWLATKPKPEPGRILFAGSVGLRKGTHYLAEAARLLKSRGVACEIVVIGPYDSSAIQRPEFQGPTYVGRVPRSRMQEEFARADVFVHPSLAEGSAMAHLEALASGLPIVATPNAGTVIRDGIDGYIVPARDGKALADRLAAIVSDRALRARMSTSAREYASQFTWQAYQRRLLEAFERLPIGGR